MRAALAVILSLIATPATAELTRSDAYGFEASHSVETSASPERSYEALSGEIAQWWSGDHSWSGDASNFYIDLKPGGCFCERLPGGGNAEHLRLLFYKPNDRLVFDGALGPLLTMPVNGRMTWKVEATETGSRITFTYLVTGHPSANLEAIAPAVDGVIGEQLDRLKELLESD